MKAHIASQSDREAPPDFEVPGNIVFLWVDKATGTALPGEAPGAIREAFIAGTQPGADSFSRPGPAGTP
jgi:membrane carboxypeptidase/penicillin-binding protein